ncbi:transposase [Synoicihabitans lomoniglobus]|uniref:Transposase n=1 Tax=Synoicihabitans lomoniglobus TaxID=2909285 RepID=A0AAF0CR05_9BACT|nr:transposase [Opitutaceae bacterium LMO-M01]WED66454.1 transposase [Opitutaceae bacterium LMO-M01]
MPRTARLEYAGACYHVINRGNYRRDIFESDGAREAFERTLLEACERYHWRLHAYVIMRNHFHLALETPEANLSSGMKWLQGTWVARFNRLRGLVGRPFQGRFKSLHVQPGHALAEVCHYIHLNPVRAGVVGADEVASFRWSSLYQFTCNSGLGSLIGNTVLTEAGQLPDSPAGWRRYLRYLVFRAAEDPGDRDEQYRHLSRGWCIGSEAFRSELSERLSAGTDTSGKRRFGGLESKARQIERERGWEKCLLVGAKAAGLDLTQLPARKSDPAKVLVAAAMKMVTDASNGWLANRLAMGEPASVSQFVRRFTLQRGDESAEFQAILSRVKQCPL